MIGDTLRGMSATFVAILPIGGTGCTTSKERRINSYTMAAGEALHEGDLERGVAYLSRLIGLEPGALAHYFGLARAYETMKCPDLAIAVYQEYLDAVPAMSPTRRADIDRRIEALRPEAEKLHPK